MMIKATMGYCEQIKDDMDILDCAFEVLSEYRKAFNLQIRFINANDEEAVFAFADRITIAFDFEERLIKFSQPLGLWREVQLKCTKFQDICGQYFMLEI